MQKRLAVKLKLLLSFYQIATRVPEVYQVSFPASVHATISAFTFVNLELATVVPPACLGLDSFYMRLLGAMLLPLLLVLATPLVGLCASA